VDGADEVQGRARRRRHVEAHLAVRRDEDRVAGLVEARGADVHDRIGEVPGLLVGSVSGEDLPADLAVERVRELRLLDQRECVRIVGLGLVAQRDLAAGLDVELPRRKALIVEGELARLEHAVPHDRHLLLRRGLLGRRRSPDRQRRQAQRRRRGEQYGQST
jgi:hypothetical protein